MPTNSDLYTFTRRLLGLPAPLLFISSETAEGQDGRIITGYGDGAAHGNGHGGHMVGNTYVFHMPSTQYGCGRTDYGDPEGGSIWHVHEL